MTDVGSARVEVTGDVRNFARQTERDLDAALSRIKLDPVKIEVDSEGLRKSGEEAGASLAEGITRGADGRLRDQRGRFVSMGRDAGKAAGEGVERGAKDSLGKGRFSSFLKDAFTPNPGMFQALRAPFAAALSTPIGAAVITVAGTAALAFVGAFAAALATAGLGAVFLGIGAAALIGTGKLDASLNKLGETLKRVGQSAAQPLLDPLNAALETLNEAVIRIEPLLTSIFSGLAPAIGPLTQGMIGFVEEFLKILNEDPATLEAMRDALIALGANLPRIGKTLGQFFELLASNQNNVRNIGLLFGLIEVAIGSLAGSLFVLGKILDGLVIAWNAVRSAISAAVGWITGTAVPAITGAVSSIGQAFSFLAPVVTGVWRVISAVVGTAWKLIVNVVTTGIRVTQGIIATVSAAIRGNWQGTWNGIRSIVLAVLNGIRTAVSAVMNGIRGVISGALASARAAWSAGWNAMVSVVSNAASRVRSAVSGVRSAVIGAFSGAGGWLSSAGRRIIDGLVNGIRAGIGRVRSVLSSVTSMIPSWKGPADVDRRLLEDSGRLVMQGFEHGLESQFASVRKTLGDLTGDIPAFTAPAGRSRGGDGAALGSGSLHVTIQAGAIVVQGQGKEAGQEAAEAILERLGAATLAR